MSARNRSCRSCGDRFTPVRFDQVNCRPCEGVRREADLIEGALFASPGQTVDRVAIVTGIAAERIRELASEGLLGRVPVGADMPQQCVCEPGAQGRCPYCRSQLAIRFAEARYEASKDATGPDRGLRMRRA
jgi:hypothetical protein